MKEGLVAAAEMPAPDKVNYFKVSVCPKETSQS